jgi:hypothetical protein
MVCCADALLPDRCVVGASLRCKRGCCYGAKAEFGCACV